MSAWVVCRWCHKVAGEYLSRASHGVTHGVCKKCEDKLVQATKVKTLDIKPTSG